jgi:endonuclease/exonuclease/phosphatase family metal-dependent hydrolase
LPDGFDFTLVVVHLKAYSDPRSTSIREEELSLLGQWVQTYLDDPENDRDLIIAGDFNEHLLTNKKAFSLLDPKGLLYLVTKNAPQQKMPELDGSHRSHLDLPGSGIREIRGFLRLLQGSYATG